MIECLWMHIWIALELRKIALERLEALDFETKMIERRTLNAAADVVGQLPGNDNEGYAAVT